MTTNEIIKECRDIAEIGNVNARHTIEILQAAADRLEALDERMAIMIEGNNIGVMLDSSSFLDRNVFKSQIPEVKLTSF